MVIYFREVQMFKTNKVLMKIFGSKEDEVREQCMILHREEFCAL